MYLLELTDGETTIDLIDGAGVCLEFNAWAPAISAYRLGTYPDVRETLPLAIHGTTGTAVMTRLRTLLEMVDRARRFGVGENARPVRLRYQQTVGSAIFVALIVGGAVIAPDSFTNQENWKLLHPVYLELDRRGLWLTPDGTNQVSNGGFEDWSGTPEEPDDWTLVDASSTGEGAATKEDTITYSGDYSLMADDFTSSSSAKDNQDYIYQTVTLDPGTSVLFSARIYTSLVGCVVRLVTDGTTVYEKTVSFPFGEWQYISEAIVVGDDGEVDIRFEARPLPDPSTFYVDNVSLSVLNETGDAGDTDTDTAVDNGDLAQFQLTASTEPYRSPTKFIVENILVGTRHPASYLIATNGADKITIIDAGGLTPATNFSAVADASSLADGNVLRYTPASTAVAYQDFIEYNVTGANISFAGSRVAIFANVRNNSNSTDFTMWAQTKLPFGNESTRPIVLQNTTADARGLAPRWVSLGTIPVTPKTVVRIAIQASAASGTLDIDTFVVVNMDNGDAAIVEIDGGENVGTSSAGTLIINHHALTENAPQIELTEDSETSRWSGSGQIFISTDAPQLEAVFLGTGGGTGINYWRQEASSAVVANDWTASRLPGRLTPE